jgi:hypothetical protein
MSEQQSLNQRLGYMADAMVSAKVGPQARFFSRERVDEIVLLLREAEKYIVNEWRGIQVDRDAEMLRELRVYLDTQHIDGDNIGSLRRALFVPWQSQWNGWVRDETASRELSASSQSGERQRPREHD